MQILLNNTQLLKFILVAVIIVFILELLSSNSMNLRHKQKNKRDKNLSKGNSESSCGIVFGLEKKGYNKKNKSVLYSPHNKEGHVLVVGGSGYGKTSAILIPTLRSWMKNPKNSSLTIDISGDIISNVPDNSSLRYEPDNSSSIPYNVFSAIDTLSNNAEKNAMLCQLALLLMPDDPNASEAGMYYQQQGRAMFTAALIAFYHQGYDFIEICKIFCESNAQQLLNKIDMTGNPDAIIYINQFENVGSTLIANSKQNASQALILFSSNECLKQTIRRPKKNEPYFAPEKVETNNCFIVIPESELEYYSPLLKLLVAQCFEHFKDRPLNADHNILFALDEAASFGNIDILPCLQRFRKRKIRLMVLTQGINSIDMTWGEKSRKAMLPNFRYKIVLESSEPDEQDYWARLAGRTNDISQSITDSGNHNISYTKSEYRDYVIQPSSLANLDDDLILFYPGGYETLQKNYYFL